MTRNDILKEVRTYLGTPFVFQARTKGVGIDCVGLLTNILDSYNIKYKLPLLSGNKGTYKLRPAKGDLIKCLECCLNEIKEPKEASVVCMWYSVFNHDTHLGWYAGSSIIHTYTVVKKVVEHPIDKRWEQRFMKFYDLPGVRD